MMTKFLQAVNRSGRKFSNYMKELFGKTPAYDYHNPMFLAHTSDLVGAAETENTGAAQITDNIAVTSRLRATSSRYAFEFQPDRDCIVIGLSYYDLPACTPAPPNARTSMSLGSTCSTRTCSSLAIRMSTRPRLVRTSPS